MKVNRGPALLLTVGGVAVLVLAVVVVVTMRAGPSSQQAQQTPSTAHRVGSPLTVHEHVGEAERAEGPDLDATREAAEEIEPTGYSIAGRVVDESGAGIAGAEVEVLEGPPGRWWDLTTLRTLKTDETGAFSGKDIPRRRLALRAGKEGYCAYSRGYHYWNHIADLHPVEYSPERSEVTGITLVLRRGLEIAGRVIDEAGQPIPGAAVQLWTGRTHVEVETDEQGCFVVAGLMPGICYLRPETDGFLVPARYREQQFSAGERDVVFQLERALVIQGAVRRVETGKPVSGAEVFGVQEPSRASQTSVIRTRTDGDGRFSLDAAPNAKTTLYAHWEDYVSPADVVVDQPPANELPEHVVLELVRGGSISGTVLNKDTGELVPGVRVRTFAGVPRRGVRHITIATRKSRALSVGVSQRWANSTTDEAGRFSLVGLRTGQYRVTIGSDGYRLPGHVEVDITAGAETTGVELLIEQDTRELADAVSGRVVDTAGEPIAAALIQPLVGDHLYPYDHLAVLSDAEGRFTIPPQGKQIGGLLAVHPDFVHAYVPLDQSDADENGEEPIVIVLKQGGASIAGIVRDGEGTPRQDMLVVLHGEQGIVPPEATERPDTYDLKDAVTDEQGRFRLQGLAPGTYWVSTAFAGLEQRSSDIGIQAGQSVTDIVFIVERPAGIAGCVTTPDGAPIEGITMHAQVVDQNTGGSRGTTRYEYAVTDAEGRFRLEGFRTGDVCYVFLEVKSDQPYLSTVEKWDTRVTCPAEHVDFVLEPVKCGALDLTVYRRTEGVPLAEFRVDLEPQGEGGTRRRKHERSADGRLTFDSVHAGTYPMRVSAAGLVESANPVEIRAGKTTRLTIYLDDSAIVKGVVVRKSDGSPVPRFLLSLENEEGKLVPLYNRCRFRNADGSFECTQDVGPGTYRIVIEPDELPAVQTAPFTVAAGAESVHRIEIPDGLTLAGHVVDESGHAVAEATLDLSVRVESGQQRRRSANTDEHGAFTITGLSVGEGRLRVSHPDYAELRVDAVQITSDPPMDELVLVLDEGVRVFGRITCRAGDTTPSSVDLRSPESSGRLDADVDVNGRFEFPHVAPGAYYVTVRGTHAWSDQFQVYDGQDRKVNLNLASAGSLSGRISFVPLAGDAMLFVHLQRRDPDTGRAFGPMVSVRVEEDGSYEVGQLLPGPYRLEVHAYRKPAGDYIRVHLQTVPRSPSVVISENSEATANVTAIEQPAR